MSDEALEVEGPLRTLGFRMEKFADKFTDQIGETMTLLGEEIAGDMREEIRERLDDDPTGRMMRSVVSNLRRDGEDFELEVGPRVPYAGIQNSGGVIRSKRPGGWIAIPLPGVPRDTSPRDYAGELFVIPSRKPNTAILAERRPGGGFDAKYVLKKSVTIKGVKYIEATAAKLEGRADELAELLADTFDKF